MLALYRMLERMSAVGDLNLATFSCEMLLPSELRTAKLCDGVGGIPTPSWGGWLAKAPRELGHNVRPMRLRILDPLWPTGGIGV